MDFYGETFMDDNKNSEPPAPDIFQAPPQSVSDGNIQRGNVQSFFSANIRGTNQLTTRSAPSLHTLASPPPMLTTSISIGSLDNETQETIMTNLRRNRDVQIHHHTSSGNRRDTLDRDFPSLPHSRSNSPDATSMAQTCRQYMTWGNICWLFVCLIELLAIGYGGYSYHVGSHGLGITLMAVFGGFFVATLIAKYCMYKYCPSTVDSPSSENDNEIDAGASVNHL
jgi:hypothetical protein